MIYNELSKANTLEYLCKTAVETLWAANLGKNTKKSPNVHV